MRVLLLDYACFYVRLLDGSSGYLDQFRWAISRFEQWVGRSLYVDELNETLVNDYLAATKEKLSPETRLSRRNMLVRLWRHAYTNPTLAVKPAMPNRDLIGRVKKRRKMPQAWTVEQARKLLTVAESLTGQYKRGPSKALYWIAYILVAWSSGLRRCDILCLNKSDITPSGRIAVVQVKTGRHVVGSLSDEALRAVELLCASHGNDRIFTRWCHIRTWRRTVRRLVRKSGLPGAIGRLRHSAGTAVENLYPGKGPQFLGNTPAVFYAHYYDRRLASDFPSPPPLTTG